MTKPWDEIEAGGGFNSHVRALFISDVHLGTRTAHAADLLDFLKHFEADVIYLVGDIPPSTPRRIASMATAFSNAPMKATARFTRYLR